MAPARTDRQQAQHLYATQLLDAPVDPAYERVTRLVARSLGVSCSLMTLVEGDRQWFVSAYGLGEPWHTQRQTPLTHSFCRYVIERGVPLVVPDARRDAELCTNQAISALSVIAYLGVPMRDADGYTVGSLSAIAPEPRDWRDDEVELLAEFAALAMSEVQRRVEVTRRRGTSAQFRELLRQIPDAVVAAEPDTGRLLYWNARAEALWARPFEADALALGDAVAHLEDGRALAHAELPLSRVVAGAPDARLEYAIMRPDGSERWVHDHAFVVRGPSGAPAQCVSLAEDVTEQRREQDALRHSQRMESVGQLAGGVAHDFNNLLTVVIGNCDLALGTLAEHEASADVREIRAAGERAAALTRQLLAFSRKQVLQSVRLDLNAVVGGAHRLLERLMTGDVELRVELAPRGCAVIADRGQLEQVLVNLVVNARDAMRSGGGTVIVETGAVDVAAGHDAELAPGPYATLAVRDTGVGMDAATVARAFEPFFTTKAVGAGTGLGLSTVYGIVRQLGGTVLVSSRVGAGSTFTVYLPAVAELAALPDEPGDAARVRDGGAR